MNMLLTFKLVGSVLLIESALMLIPLAVSLFTGGTDAGAFTAALAVSMGVGGLLSLLRPKNDNLRAREGFAIVALSWILVSFFASLPFYFHGSIPSLVDCFFETVSGFTTTGATILTDVTVLPKGLLFWRSFTHWAGGMGVLVLSLALLPKMGARTIHLLRAESPGPSVDKLVPRMGKNAKILYKLYVCLSLMMLAALLCTGMSLYDALINVFGAAGTGGFSNYNTSVGAFNSPAVDIIIGVFMALFGVNFSIYYYVLRRNWKQCLKNGELRLYVALLLGSSVIIALNILPQYGYDFFHALRFSFFQVSSVMTTTGYSTANFDLWPQLSRSILVTLMVIGACAGSTGGGVKVIRVQLLLKSMVREVRRTIHPKSVNTIKQDGHAVDEQMLSGVMSFFFAYMLVTIVSTLIVSLDGFSFETNLTAVIATLSNIGPGLGTVGPMGNFSQFSDLSKIVLSLCMLIGRLEIFPILMLASPSAWRKY